MTNFNIKVISDTVCPFCYLGKKRLEKAIELYKKSTPEAARDTFNVSWHPFYLDPTLPKKSVPVDEHIARKFGADRVAMMHARIAAGGTEGINFTFKGKIGNTRDSHRLIQLGRTKGEEAQGKVMGSLFRSYFEEGGDITSWDMLVAAAERAGLDGAEARTWLEEGKGGDEVDREVEWAYGKGVHGVPHFVINDRFEIGGAQGVEAFLEEFASAKRAAGPEEAAKASKASGDQGLSC